MDKLITELCRLYFLPDQRGYVGSANDSNAITVTAEILTASLTGTCPLALDLLGVSGQVRTLVIGFPRTTDWPLVAELLQGVVADLELPTPAVAVSANHGYQVWLSLAESVPRLVAAAFLQGLRDRYLANLPPARLNFLPGIDEVTANLLTPVPAMTSKDGEQGRWSSFIDPTMGAMFIEEPWLDMAPGPDRQAAILAELHSIKATDFRRVLSKLNGDDPMDVTTHIVNVVSTASTPSEHATAAAPYRDPRSFLLAVMNDSSAGMTQRIDAAKALLPYFERNRTD